MISRFLGLLRPFRSPLALRFLAAAASHCSGEFGVIVENLGGWPRGYCGGNPPELRVLLANRQVPGRGRKLEASGAREAAVAERVAA